MHSESLGRLGAFQGDLEYTSRVADSKMYCARTYLPYLYKYEEPAGYDWPAVVADVLAVGIISRHLAEL